MLENPPPLEDNFNKYRLSSYKNWKSIYTENDVAAKQALDESLSDYLYGSMQMEHLVVLAGSGTSLSDNGKGGPSMQVLWEKCTKADGNFSDKTNEIFQILNYPETDDNIEHLLSVCEAYLQLHKDDERVSIYQKAAKSIILDECRFNPEDELLNSHQLFLKKLSRRRSKDSRLKIFTTNYDNCFELAAGKLGIIVVDGFSFSQPRIFDPRYFEYDFVRRSSSSTRNIYYLDGVFHLYKLHGSVDWARKQDGSIVQERAEAENACIIFPVRAKYQQSYTQPHLELIARFLQTIREPNTCLLINGFGFNDNHLSEPILSAIKTNPHLRVIIVDKYITNQQKREYWSSLFNLSQDGADICFICSDFKNFSRIIPDLSAISPAEKIADNIRELVANR